MRNPLPRLLARLTAPWHRRHFHGKLLKAFAHADFCFVSSNCVGGRFSQLLDRPHASPTVGLWFEPADYLLFASHLEENLAVAPEFDAGLSAARGYPVGVLNGARIHFMHYASEDEARTKWQRRVARVAPDMAFLIFTDRDGATYEHLKQFDALPFARKLLLTHKAYPEFPSAVCVPGYELEAQVGDLYSDWHMLDRALPADALQRLAAGLPVNSGKPMAAGSVGGGLVAGEMTTPGNQITAP